MAERRRQYIVDKEMQYHYLAAWIISAFLMICVFGFFFILFKVLPARNADPVIVRNLYVLLICNAFILILFSIMMGLHAVLHTHRIAGAATHIKNALGRLRNRDYGYEIVLRKNDYLKEMATIVNDIARHMKVDQEHLHALLKDAAALQESKELDQAREIGGRLRDGIERLAGPAPAAAETSQEPTTAG